MVKVRTAVNDWHRWAKAHGEIAGKLGPVHVDPGEVLRVNYNPADAGKPEPLFWSEVLPVTKSHIERGLRLMGYSRNDLVRLCSDLDDHLLRWRPDGWPRSIGDCLKHIAFTDWWYVTRLDIDLPRDFPEDIFDLLTYTRGLAEEALRGLTKEQRSRIFQPRSDPSPVCNLWTARKVLRRFVDHEMLHTRYVEKVLSAAPRKS
jgi:uncharacterized damage-inducible protein DinB